MSKRKLGSIWGHRTPGKERSEKHLAKEGFILQKAASSSVPDGQPWWRGQRQKEEGLEKRKSDCNFELAPPPRRLPPQQWPWPQLSQWWYNKVRDLWCVLHWPDLWWILCPKGASLVVQWERIRLPMRRPGLNPWMGKIPWRRKWQPTLAFLPGKSHGQTSLEGYSPWGQERVGQDSVTTVQGNWPLPLCPW